MIASWQLILDKTCKVKAKNYVSAAALIGASIAVCEAILADRVEETSILESQGLRYNDILTRLGGMSLYQIAAKIGKLLNFDNAALSLVVLAENPPLKAVNEADKLAKLLHLLLFYKFSEPFAIEAGLDDFASCSIEAVSDELENFMTLIGADLEN
jgi:hypothetical protein